MKNIKVLVIMIFFSILLAGCWDIKNIRDLNYVSAIGLDYVDDQYVVYVQLFNFKNIASNEGNPSGDTLAEWTGKGTGETLELALDYLYQSAEKPLFIGHIKAIVYSERILEKEIESSFDLLDRYRELHYDLWTFGTKEDIEALFAVQPFFNASAFDILMYNPKETYKQSSYISPVNLREFIRKYEESGATVLLPHLSINEADWSENQKKKPTLQIDGIFAIHRENESIYLKKDLLRGLRWTSEETIQSSLMIQQDNKPIAVLSVKKPKVRIEAQIENDQPIYSIQVEAHAEVSEMIQHVSEIDLKKKAEQIMIDQIQETYEQAIEKQQDIYNLEHILYRRYNKVWKSLYRKKIHLNQSSLKQIEVELFIQYTGKKKYKK